MAIGSALGGAAIRTEVTLRLSRTSQEPAIHMLLYTPAAARGPVPVVVGLNFNGNQAVAADPGIALATSWLPARATGVVNSRATDKTRGVEASRWQVDTLISRGYALATAYYGDLDPDFDDGFQNGMHPLFYRAGQTRPARRPMGRDWRVGVGTQPHARLPRDEARRGRAPRDRDGPLAAGQGGALGRRAGPALCDGPLEQLRMRRRRAEQAGVWRDGRPTSRPASRTGSRAGFARYAGREADLPVDQHELLALIAPRPLYVASAVEDRWADPRGEFLGALGADPVYRLLGTPGLGVTEMPAVDRPVGQTIGYHVRSGGHDVTAYDWEQYLAFADRHLRQRPVN